MKIQDWISDQKQRMFEAGKDIGKAEVLKDLLKRLPKPIKWKREPLEQQYKDKGFNKCLEEIKKLLTPNK